MNLKTKNILQDYFIKFCHERRAQYWRYWTKGVISRIFNRDKSVELTLGGEIDHVPVMAYEFNRLVKENKIKRHNVEDFLDALKIHKEEYVNRLGFLLVFGAMLALASKVIALFIEPNMTVAQKGIFSFAYYAVIAIFLIGALIERDGIVKRSSAAAQLIIIVERWLKK